MKLSNSFDELNSLIEMVTRKFSTTIPMSFEDLKQELWLYAVEQDFDNLALANTSLHNRAKTIYKQMKKESKVGLFPETEDGDGNKDIFMDVDISLNSVYKAEIIQGSSTANVDFFLSKLKGNKRKYVVCKAYLSGDYPELKSEYLSIISGLNLTEKQMEKLHSRWNNDAIARYIFGYTFGQGSGSFSKLKKEVKNTFISNGIY